MAQSRADEAFYFVADFVKHPANLPVHSLVQNDAEPGRPDLLHAGEPGALAVEKNSGVQFLRELRFPKTIEGDLILFLHFVARMSEVLREIAIAREQEKTFGLRVEPADIEEAGEFCGQQIVNRIGGVGIAARGNEPRRFMQRDGHALRRPNESMTDFYVIVRLYLGAEIGAGPAVNRNATL